MTLGREVQLGFIGRGWGRGVVSYSNRLQLQRETFRGSLPSWDLVECWQLECYPRDSPPAMPVSLADRIVTHFDGTVSQLAYLWH